jgi:hypothetical protein
MDQWEDILHGIMSLVSVLDDLLCQFFFVWLCWADLEIFVSMNLQVVLVWLSWNHGRIGSHVLFISVLGKEC